MENNSYNVYGVGTLGSGIYSSAKNKRAYNIWAGMLDRCYSKRTQVQHKSYVGCTVCDEWLNFQNFAKFYEVNCNDTTWHLDKDILGNGKPIYSPQSCCFVPPEINKLFVRRKLHRGDTPIGVHYEKSRKRYKASLHDGSGKTKFLGRFHDATEAFQAYKSAKEEIIKQIAIKYQGQISEKLYNALMEYQIKITD